MCVLHFLFFAVTLHEKSERRFSKLYQSLKHPALFFLEKKLSQWGPAHWGLMKIWAACASRQSLYILMTDHLITG